MSDQNSQYPGPGYPMSSAPAYTPYGSGYPAQPTNGLAITSLVAGISSWVLFPVLGSIVAIITGHIALGQLRNSRQGGRGMAVAGLVIGYINVAVSVLVIALVIIFVVAFSTAANSIPA